MHAKKEGEKTSGGSLSNPLSSPLCREFFLGRKFWHATLDLMGILLQGRAKKTKKEFMVIGSSSSSLQFTQKRRTTFSRFSSAHAHIFFFFPVLIYLRSRARENEVSWPVVDPIYRSNINHWSAVGWGKRLRRTEGGILKFPNCRHSLLFPGFLF